MATAPGVTEHARQPFTLTGVLGMYPLEGVARETVGQRTRLRGQFLNPISQPKPLVTTVEPRMPVEIKDAGQCACSQSHPSMLGEHLSEKRSHGTPDGVILVRVQ